MEKNSASVRWNDGTYDFARGCDTCGATGCAVPTHNDLYREIHSASYWQWAEKNVPRNADDVTSEPVRANPDVIMVHQDVEDASESRAMIGALADAAYEKLSEPQKEVWDLCMRRGISEEVAAERLGKSQQAVSRLLIRAKAIFTNSLRENQ